MLLYGHGSAATDSKVVMVGGCWALFCSGNYASWLVQDALWRWEWIYISCYPLYCLVRSLLTQQSTATIMVLSLKLNKWGLGNAEYAWIRKCALQSLTFPGSTAS